MTAPKLVVGNWKDGGSLGCVREFGHWAARDWPACEAALCVPHPLLAAAQAALGPTPLRWGAQDCSAEDGSLATGEVPTRLLREFGARYVILGHSERRQGHGETDGQVVEKVKRAMSAGLTPIVCVGENAEERDGGQTAMVLRWQLMPLMRTLGRCLPAVVIAYEPVWAHSMSDDVPPGLVEDAHRLIAETLAFHAGSATHAVRIVYAGSVDARNAAALLSRRLVAGVLVGEASRMPAEFLEICKAAARCSEPRLLDAA